ncbi:hypothetical protein CRYUN_Cryun30bG0044200 [Craigia yunnanensis]
MSSKGHSHNKFLRFITVPFRALGRARDLYVRSLTSCASRVSYGHSSGDYTGQYSGLPRSFSASSATSDDNEDLRELIRAASVRNLGNRNEIEMFLRQQLRLQLGSKGLPKSCSVGMGRIDEDKPCEFEENDAVVVDKRQDFFYNESSYLQWEETQFHYVGTLLDGFCSTKDNDEPLTFKLAEGQVAKCLDHGIITMKKGKRALFTLPPDFSYGAEGGDGVPLDSIIQFETELLLWIMVVDIRKDGIIKKILKKGERNERPSDLDDVLGSTGDHKTRMLMQGKGREGEKRTILEDKCCET